MLKSIHVLFVAVVFSVNVAADEIPKKVKEILPQLQSMGKNQVVIEAVKKQNKLRLKMADIQRKDKEWISTSGLNKEMISMLNNPAAQALKQVEQQNPDISESFVMDNQGANVAMTNKTSDYWQGDEDKFIKSYLNGKGSVHIGKVKFDESSQAYLVQVSVPVVDHNRAIGAITFGINVDE